MISIHVVKLVYIKHTQYSWDTFISIHAVQWVAYMSYSGHTVNTFSICDAWLVYMKYSVYIHTAHLVCILYGCYTWGTVGIYEIQLACILCMGLIMRYSGHKRVKKYQSIHLALPQLLLKVLIYLALIHFSRKYSFLKYTPKFQHQPGGVF